MVGLVQKLFFDMLMAFTTPEVIQKIRENAGIPADKNFQINEVYSDEEWQRLFKAALDILKLTPEQADEIYADYFLKDALKRFPIWFELAKNSYDFLCMQPTIHNCFATSVLDEKSREAINDKFKVDKLPNKLVTHYNSKNHHCGLYVALAKCVVKHYQDEVTIHQPKCIKDGAANCEIHIEWSKLGS